MAYDGIVLRAVIDQLRPQLLNGRIDKITQPLRQEIILHLHNQSSNYKLLLSAHPQNARLHLTTNTKTNPQSPPTFCMVLRKHLQGSRLRSIKQIDLERIAHLEFEAIDELGNLCTRTLVIEIMGKHSNIFLLNEQGQILDCLRRISQQQSQQREAYPGIPYVLPPVLNKTDPLNCSEDDFRRLILERDLEQRLDKVLLNSFSGFSKQICQGILRTSGLADLGQPQVADLGEYELRCLWQVFSKLCRQIEQQNYQPNILFRQQTPCDFLAVDLLQPAENEQLRFGNMQEIADEFYRCREQEQSLQTGRENIAQLLKEVQARLTVRADLQQNIINRREEQETLRRTGEVLTAFLYQLQPGITQIELPDIYDPEQKPLLISLNPELSPADNAQRYFKKYNKLKRALGHAEEQLQEIQAELSYLDSVIDSLNNSVTLEDLEEIREELRERHYLKEKTKSKLKTANKPEYHFNIYRSADGMEIYVGKNNKQNDFLTFKIARSNDLWLHVKDIPGSHVIINNHGRAVSDKTLRQAAELAAWFSKYRSAANVPVDYTQVSNVQKPRGAKPGFVIYFHQKTIVVDPRES